LVFVAKKNASAVRCKRPCSFEQIPQPLSLEEITLFKQLPVLTLEQVGRVLQKTTDQVHEMSRSRAARPLPVFRAGRSIASTWAKIQGWIDEGFAERKAA
jgi:hypothetical protein